jgi:uncharacterized protein (TIGR02246 family)
MSTNTLGRVTAENDAAIRQTLQHLYKAWADNDADAFMTLYTEDASSNLPGSYRPNPQVIHTQMAGAFAGPLKGSTVVNEVLDIRMVGQDAAVLVTRDGVLLAGESTVPAERLVMATWTMAKRDGRWLIAAYHNCPASLD